MGVILDTCIWVDVERGQLAPADVAEITGRQAIFITPVTLAELQFGIMRAKSAAIRNKRQASFLIIQKKPCLNIDGRTGIIFGQLSADLQASGRATAHRVQDVWIASLSIQHNMPVLTHNTSDFADIPGVDVLAI